MAPLGLREKDLLTGLGWCVVPLEAAPRAPGDTDPTQQLCGGWWRTCNDWSIIGATLGDRGYGCRNIIWTIASSARSGDF